MRQDVTGKDVAKLAGVSPATVSYVLAGNEKQRISEETRERVLAAAEELGYYPNRQARGLRSRKTHCVSVMLDKELAHPRYAGVMQGLREKLEESGYRVLLCSEEPSGAYPQYLAAVLEKQADGVIYIGSDGKSPSREVLSAVRQYRIPFVLYDCMAEGSGIAAVVLDYREAVEKIAQNLAGRGCRRLW